MYQDADEIDSEFEDKQTDCGVLGPDLKRKVTRSHFPREVELSFASKSDSAKERKYMQRLSVDKPSSEDLRECPEDSTKENGEPNANATRKNESKQIVPNAKWRLFRQILCIDCC